MSKQSEQRSDDKQQSSFTEQLQANAVILGLLVLAIIVGVFAWIIGAGSEGKIDNSSSGERQGVERQPWVGIRDGQYYGLSGKFKIDPQTEVEEQERIINIDTPNGPQGIITLEYLEFDDTLPRIESQSGGQRRGLGVVYPTNSTSRGRGTTLIGNDRWEIYLRGPGSAALAEKIVASARPR